MEDLNLNVNNSQCLVKKLEFTGTTVTNICSSEVTFVPHGSLDYTVFILLAIIITFVCGFVGIAIINIVKD